MRIKHLSVAVVTAAGVLAFSGGAAVAATTTPYGSNNCTSSGFTGGLGVCYQSTSTYFWTLNHTIYQLSPSDSSSDRNNVSASLFGGSATAPLKSTGSAHRDGLRHTLWTYEGTNYWAAKNKHAYVTQTVVFDRFGTDPRCTTQVYLP